MYWFDDISALFNTNEWNPMNATNQARVNIFTKLSIILSIAGSIHSGNTKQLNATVFAIAVSALAFTLIRHLCDQYTKETFSNLKDTTTSEIVIKEPENPLENKLSGVCAPAPKSPDPQKALIGGIPMDASDEIFGNYDRQFYKVPPRIDEGYSTQMYGNLGKETCKEASIYAHLGEPASMYFANCYPSPSF